ncbi:MAG: HAD-IB family hydrolase [Verrucomicrobiota bacterium]
METSADAMGSRGGGERRYALFDLDQTLVPYDTQLLMCNRVLRTEGWRRLYLILFVPVASLGVLRMVSLRTMKRIFLSYWWGMTRERVLELAAEFVERDVLPAVYPEVKAELERHRAEGRVTVLNTASPDFYARVIADRLGFDYCFGTRVELPERMPLIPEIPGANNKQEAKIEAMREVLPPYFVKTDVLADSYAYSDSSADLPMLRIVDHPVMVDPSKRLRAEGENAGWEEVEVTGRVGGGEVVKMLLGIRP